MNRAEHNINKSYNLFLFRLLMWEGFKVRINDDIKVGYKPVKTIEKMNKIYNEAVGMSKHLDLSDLTKYKSWYPVVDDEKLVATFLDTLAS